MTPGLVERHPLKEKRRANKPLLERKRRARINDSLADLKKLVLSSLNKDVSKYTKMEKVDILDMTVQFLKGNCFEKPIEDHVSIYRAGYTECTQQVYQSIMTMDGVDHTHKCRILSQLAEKFLPDDRQLTPPPSPKSFCSKSPLSSLSRSPCISTLYDHTIRQNMDSNGIVIPMVSTDVHRMNNVNVEHYLPYNMNRYNVSQEQLNRKVTTHSKIQYPKLPNVHPGENGMMSSSGVWRPW